MCKAHPGGAGLEEPSGDPPWDSLPELLALDPDGNLRVARVSWGWKMGLCSLRGKELDSHEPAWGKDQPRQSGAFSRTIIGDFVPKPDSGSIG